MAGWFCGKDAHCGVCAVLEPPPGPATLVGFTPHPHARGGFRYVVARGDLTKALTVKAHAFSGAAKAKIESAGGRAEVID